MLICIQKAMTSQSGVLSDISLTAKRYWNYPEAYFEVWKDELIITGSYIEDSIVYVAEQEGEIVGYFSIVEVKDTFWAGEILVQKGFWLEHIFIMPEFIGMGIGSRFLRKLS